MINYYWENKVKNKNFSIDYIGLHNEKAEETICRQYCYEVDRKIVQNLRQFCMNSDYALYVAVVTAILVVGYKYSTDKKTFIFGGHPFKKTNHGMAKIFPVIGNVDEKCSLKMALNNMKQKFTEIENNKEVTINYLQNLLKERLAYCKYSVIIENWYPNYQTRFFQEKIIFKIKEEQNQLWIKMDCYSGQYNEKAVRRIYSHIICVLERMIENPKQSIDKLSFVTEEEKNIILTLFNNTNYKYSLNETVPEIFAKTVKKYPNQTAYSYNGRNISFAELDKWSTRLASYLRNHGISRNCIIGLLVDRSFEMVIGILGVIKAGCAYLPMSLNDPEEKIKFIISDSQMKLLLTKHELKHMVNSIIPVIELDDKEIYKFSEENFEYINKLEDLIYVIYTSGSTGNPKGVMISHAALINRIAWMQRKYPIGCKDVILQKTNYCFDVSVWEILWGCFTGATVCLAGHGVEMNMQRIKEYIEKQEISVIHFVPSVFSEFVNYLAKQQGNSRKLLKSIKYIFCSGEELKASDVNCFQKIAGENRYCLVNLYGPTEAAIDVTYYECNKQKKYRNVPIGKPIDNIKVYVVEKNGKLAPINVPGELWISGVGLAKGYLNRALINKEKFISGRFGADRVYRTGDFVRWDDDGNIKFISRIDNQLKLRGFRIEAGEIENRLLQYKPITQVKVLLNMFQNESFLCAYIVSDEEIDTTQIRKILKISLPGYMIPSYFFRLDKMPVTENGKLDVQKLKSIKLDEHISTSVVLPESAEEIKLADIFKNTLERTDISVMESLFDMGGHSLMIFSLISKIYEAFQVSVTVKEMYQNPSVRDIAGLIVEKKRVKSVLLEPIVPVEEREWYKTTNLQKRIYKIQNENPQSIYGNTPVFYLLDHEPDLSKIEKIIKVLCKQHDELRMVFNLHEGEICQKYSNNQKVDFIPICFSQDPYKDCEKFVKPFNLKKGTLFRIGGGYVLSGKYILAFDIHSIICDGLGLKILIRDFMKLYHGKQLNKLDITYKDYAEWYNHMLFSDYMKVQKEYWLKKLKDKSGMVRLKSDFNGIENKKYYGVVKSFTLEDKLSNQVLKYCRNNGKSEYIIFLAVISLLLYQYSNQEEFMVGSPVSGRRNMKLEDVVGLFMNVIVLQIQVSGDYTFRQLITLTEQIVNEALEYQEYQIDDIIDDLNKLENRKRSKLFNVMYSYTYEEIQNQLENIQLLQKKGKSYANNDFHFIVHRRGEQVDLKIKYISKLFQEESIDRLYNVFNGILTKVLESPEIAVGEIINGKTNDSNR
ncbi:non-ribosomal peptide synthetase [Clostridium felsineum]|uniref:non-ribosomal peptide synthetase n=1 Tax=Clostridium felsineum TaxID=36839 RepID=UPI00098BE1BF|nr:non-ribosomal peptide synthetase [Clostridium felsineum]URZ01279.1 Tyrocidine synthase 3 [Clostridium felsineum]